jgi:cytoskeletal protein RodZ
MGTTYPHSFHPHTLQDNGWRGFGEWLEQARKARGLTLEDLRRETKISLRHLEALEHGNLGIIPAFYQRAEVRAIARAVGVDEGLAIGRLSMATTPPASAVEEPAEEKEEAAWPWPSLISMPAFVALAFVATIAVAGIGVGMFGGTASPVQPAAEPAAPVTPLTPVAAPEQIPAARPAAASAAAPEVAEPPESIAAPESVVPPASMGEAEIVVTTIPSGARVTVNGISWGVSPVTIRNLPPGPKRIRVTKDGFVAREQVLLWDQSRRQTLDLRLTGMN